MKRFKIWLKELKQFFTPSRGTVDTKDFTLWPKMVNVDVGKIHVKCKNGFPGDGSVLIDGKEYEGVQRVIVTIDANSNELAHVDLRVYPDHFAPVEENQEVNVQ